MAIRHSILALGLLALFLWPGCGGAQDFDRVIRGGRVMDPETGLDAIRDIGIRGDTIERISESPLTGREVIDASGLVVAPGFIDLHQHTWDDESYAFKIRDGVTSILELEVGTDDVAAWYRAKEGKLPLHHGVAVGHIPVRMRVMGDFPGFLPKSDSRAAMVTADDAQLAALTAGIQRGLDAGAVAVGFGIRYTPAATSQEILAMFRQAAESRAACHVHLRERAARSVGSTLELIGMSATSGAALHLVHLSATGAASTPDLLRLVSEAQARGLDVTAEMYPWTAGMTDISAAMFGPGWQEEYGIGYGDLQWGATGERLTEESFRRYRESGGLVIIHSNTEAVVTAALKSPATFVASDGLAGHPRNAGTCARILGHYVRDRGEIDLMTALSKLSLLPARRLEARVPEMKRRGRIQPGCIADLTLFDLESVAEKATFTDPKQPSEGIAHVLVAGVPVVSQGRIVDGALPGRAIRAAVKKP
ncbi:MAG: amidohydrolase family protein [Verrucomicrobiales bacterium]|nr:amidohydrolase family protein [Verrucomicrobiales bacterium]